MSRVRPFKEPKIRLEVTCIHVWIIWQKNEALNSQLEYSHAELDECKREIFQFQAELEEALVAVAQAKVSPSLLPLSRFHPSRSCCSDQEESRRLCILLLVILREQATNFTRLVRAKICSNALLMSRYGNRFLKKDGGRKICAAWMKNAKHGKKT